ncbi:MAG TPA: sugar ABC transporter substrate-binding protein, partial [Candidatus Pelethocola excrementipullorum]|nr:sugar ABC transporter substrate-binding protein [Candidatus Pelethocola excrementipullorum]
MKKMVSILLAASMFASVLAGCGGNGGPSNVESSGQGSESKGDDGDQVTISFYSWWADAEQQMGNALIEAFEKEHPNIKVEPTYIAESDYLSKLNTLVAADNMPDVYYLNEYLVTDWGISGVSADINPLFDEIGVNPEDIWLETALHKSDDNLYGINYGSTTIAFYYNKKMFEEAGITPPKSDATDPWTWEEYVDAAIKLTKDINGNTPADEDFDYDSCTQFGTTMTGSWIYWLPVLYAAGTSIADDAGEKLEITSQTAKDALQAIADLSSVHQCAPTVGVTDSVFSDTSAMLMNGQLGMFIGGTFLLGNFTAENYDVGIAQIPTMNGAKPSNMVWSAAYAMSAKSKHPKEAAQFLEFMADFDNSVKESKESGIGLGALPSTIKTL